MSIYRKVKKSPTLTIPCFYDKKGNSKVPITAVSYIEFLGDNIVKLRIGDGRTVKWKLPEETIKLLHAIFPNSILV